MAAVLIQADDFSGAAEVAQCFAQHGLSTRILLEPSFVEAGISPVSDVVVVDTHSRSSAPEDAATAVARAFAGQAVAGSQVLFKKIDSLWRGNVGAEVGALAGLGYHVLVAGALPQLRRTVVDGRPYADGVPLAETALWKAEADTPPSHLSALGLSGGELAAGGAVGDAAPAGLQTLDLAAVRSDDLAARLSQLFSRGVPTTVIADGETEADLEAVVEALARLVFAAGGRRIVLVGTGGIADVLARSVRSGVGSAGDTETVEPAHNTQAPVPDPSTSSFSGSGGARPALAVVGSASAAARRQLRELQAGGFRLVGLTPDELRRHTADSKLHAVREALAAGDPVALTVTAEQVDPRQAGEIVRNLARFVSEALEPATSGTPILPDLILTGGETAREVLDTLGIRTLEPLEAVQHGAVTSLADDGRLVGTKPGSFGDDQALLQLYSSIQGRRTTDPAGLTKQKPLDPSDPSGEAMNSALNATQQDTRPFIAVTMGDGAGVGPEVTVGALLAENAYRDCRPVVIGDLYRLELGAKALGVKAEIVEIQDVAEAVFEPVRINVIDPKLLPHDLPWGVESAVAGNAAYHYIRIACELGMSGQVQGICTAPLNKAALHKAGHIYPGHTELLAHFMGIEEVSMMLSTPKVKVIHVTTHIGLIDAVNKIEPGLVERTVRRGHSAMQRAGIANPKIGVCAINPHAGENGLFGYGEEAEKITPAIEKLQADGINAIGPLPADTAFFLAGRGDYDLIVAMYHDQGHGPVKVLGIEAGVNITVGLPVIRTSVDHGTAFDIAGKGIVDVRSMIEALRQAAEMSPSPALQK
ncbi:4-hydroxythreonine-4-phosphate dehydrogenase [Arthrobacter sp. V4I6]|uniref:4-hydroxythreonine-4-phosphate dehydrogenase PdxA n=1 Tax=unclassified Arthrobacter TaxID=235627 RepID=UPI0027806F91|nr:MULTISPECIES: 4-hydroxythreonine-4-phosphate dehydrogenase PdxA [unclassified Arthrobacter]MDQ0822407.1 4-hydroxythreonine-4-phosphate dehydrogenase [Arthrobacter sp. V1I7]MDQ0852033.1 4-hydroxythreonine-4-phosphate dehydrogenase [Arthrobacter sp. V4I6]